MKSFRTSCPRQPGRGLISALKSTAAVAVTIMLAASLGDSAAFASADVAAVASPGRIVPAQVATGGIGNYRDSIDWLEFGTNYQAPRLPAWTTPVEVGDGQWLSTRCDITNVLDQTPSTAYDPISGEPKYNPTRPAVPLYAYTPGTYWGDGLDDLYNVGGSGFYNDSTAPAGYRPFNRMVNALVTNDRGADGVTLRNQTTVSFRFSCGAWLIATPIKPTGTGTPVGAISVPLAGLVFADAESSNWWGSGDPQGDPTWREWIKATPVSATGASWHLLDSYRSPACPTDSWGVVTGSTVMLRPNRAACTSFGYTSGQGPSSVMFLNGATSADVTLQGGGRTAVALGVMISSDYGDAPQSYGVASALFQTSITGGALLSGTNNLSLMRLIGNVAKQGTSTPILGSIVDPESSPHYSAGANWDDLTFSDDEDAVVWPTAGVAPVAGSFTQRVTCTGSGELAGWIDWNINGAFDAGEKSGQTPCLAAGYADLTWTVPADAKPSGTTYARIRLTSQQDATGKVVALKPIGMTTVTGEVEDYQITLAVPPGKLDVAKASNPATGTAVTPGQNVSYTLTFKNSGGQPIGVDQTDSLADVLDDATMVGSPTADSPLTAALSGTNLRVTGTLAAGATATVTYTVAVKSPLTANGSLVNYVVPTGTTPPTTCDPAVSICTEHPVKLTLSWSKVSSGASATLLSGSEWTLTPLDAAGAPIPSKTVAVVDCITTPCTGADTDPTAGKFLVIGLSQGTYQLVETKAPAEYLKLTDPINVTVNANVAYGDIINTKISVPKIPLTGGVGEFGFVATAGGLAALGALALVLQRRRARRAAR